MSISNLLVENLDIVHANDLISDYLDTNTAKPLDLGTLTANRVNIGTLAHTIPLYINGVLFQNGADITVQAPIVATDNNGLTINNATHVAKLEYADATHNGILSTTNQNISGTKVFLNNLIVGPNTPSAGVTNIFNTYYLYNLGTVNVTGALTGTFELVVQVVGAVATLMMDKFTNASSVAGFATVTQKLPSEFRPATVGGRFGTLPILEFGVYGNGGFNVATDGTITIGIGFDSTGALVPFGFGAGNGGWPDCTVSYNTV